MLSHSDDLVNGGLVRGPAHTDRSDARHSHAHLHHDLHLREVMSFREWFLWKHELTLSHAQIKSGVQDCVNDWKATLPP